MKKIVFIAKTNLNTDGRILNQLMILNEYFPLFKVDFILFPDKPTIVEMPGNTNLMEVNTKFRNSKILRPLIVAESSYLILKKLILINPNILHVQDSSVVLPAYLYKVFYNKNVNIIYDDHELPNENISLYEKLMVFFENKLIKRSHNIIFANNERMLYLINRLKLSNDSVGFLLNLPYYENKQNLNSLSKEEKNHYNNIIAFKEKGFKIILHQGPINEARGNYLLMPFLEKLDFNIKVIFLGGSLKQFEMNLSSCKNYGNCYFVGSVQYDHLDLFWNLADASIILYSPQFINNRLCAPNRYFLSLFKNIPTIVNYENPVLRNFNTIYNSGIYIEDVLNDKIFVNDVFSCMVDSNEIKILRESQIDTFVGLYKSLIYEKY